MINRAIITGRLTATPELKKTAAGTSILRFSVANELYKTTTFIDVTTFNQTAEYVAKFGKQGMYVCVDGFLSSWTDSDKRKHTYITAQNVQLFFDSKKEEPEMPESEERDELPW